MEKAMAPHSSILAWKLPWMEEPGGLQSMRSDTTERFHFRFSLACIGEGNGNPLQCSCLENPRDGGAWWAAISGVAQSRTRLKWLSSSSSSVVFPCLKSVPEALRIVIFLNKDYTCLIIVPKFAGPDIWSSRFLDLNLLLSLGKQVNN